MYTHTHTPYRNTHTHTHTHTPYRNTHTQKHTHTPYRNTHTETHLCIIIHTHTHTHTQSLGNWVRELPAAPPCALLTLCTSFTWEWGFVGRKGKQWHFPPCHIYRRFA